jgi:signal transduction histidine kinase
MEHAVTRLLAESRTLAEASSKILQAIGEYLQWEFGALWEVDKESRLLRCVEVWHSPAKDFSAFGAVCRQLTFSVGVGLPGRVWKDREAAWLPDVTKDPDFPRASAAAPASLHGAFAFPIKLGNEVLGVMEFFSSEIHQPVTALLKSMDAIGSEIGQFAERLRTETKLQQKNRELQATIDALCQSEEKLRHQSQELEQQLIASGRLVSLGEITASMAHEFNNPLGIIMGFIEDILSNLDPADPNYRALKIVDEESRRCKKIISDLMEYARPRSAELCSTDVAALIEKTLQLVENRLYKQKVAAAKNLEANLPRINADPQQLEQLLINLYLNALDAMPDGGKLTIETQVELADEMPAAVALTVADTGFGIAEEDLPKIFQPFFSAKKRRGLGLGLPICARIVKNHGGRIDVESRPGEGTAFRVYLPLNHEAGT